MDVRDLTGRVQEWRPRGGREEEEDRTGGGGGTSLERWTRHAMLDHFGG